MPRLRSPHEITGRAAQALRIGLERLGVAPRGVAPRGASLVPLLPFPAPNAEEMGRFYECFPREREQILAHADAALAGRFPLLGFEALEFGFPPDWHADPTRGTRAPLVHWSRVPFLDSGAVGDHKIVWEVNRLQWLVTLAQAHLLTGELRYAEGIATALDDWLHTNPPRQGINWASSLELAFRAIAWTWTLHLLAGRLAGPADLGGRVLASLDLHGRQIERFLSTWFSPNTHLTGEALGLLYLGSAWPALPCAAAWRQRGWRILLAELPKQVRPDGTYFEQATWYQAYTVDFYLHALALARHGDLDIPDWAVLRVDAAVRVLEAVIRPDGSLPLLGDDDGGRLLPLDPERTSFGDSIGLAERVLERPATCALERVSPALVWYGAPAETHSAPATASGPAAFSDGGVYVLRGGSGALVVDAGVHGVLAGGHSHADALSVDLTVGGVPVVVDPGTGAYIGELRDRLRAWGAHNLMTLAGDAAPPLPAGPFRWRGRWPTVTVRHWRTGPGWAVLQAEHDGLRDDGALRHRRTVLFVEGFGWLLLDQLVGGEEPCQIGFQLAPGFTVSESPAGLYLARNGTPVAVMAVDGRGRLATGAGLVSRCYGRAEAAPRITVEVHADEARSGVAVAFSADPGGRLAASDGASSRTWTWRRGGDQAVVLKLLHSGALAAGGPNFTLALD